MLKLIAAPSRQLSTWSMRILIALGIFDLSVIFVETVSVLFQPKTVVFINAFMVFLTGVARLIRQNIPITTEDKSDIVAAAAAQPMKPGEDNIQVKINKVVVPSVPTKGEA